jgi:hypothetical protein
VHRELEAWQNNRKILLNITPDVQDIAQVSDPAMLNDSEQSRFP